MLSFIQLHRLDDSALADEVAAGLSLSPPQVAPKFFYDTLGSRLFDAITELPEYTPTRAEASIFSAQAGTIVQAALAHTGLQPVLVDLGAASCAKAARLLPLLQPRRYVAVDISVDYLRQALTQLQAAHPGTAMVGLGLDFSARLQLPPEALAGDTGPALVFYPGSSIGNFSPPDAVRLLRQARAVAAGGALLIGVDLVKAAAELEAAYDDALGVTAAFNLNLLRHANRLLRADFNVREWQHVALFDAAASRIEMHLQARHAVVVQGNGGPWHFGAGTRIHTENSYKWTLDRFAALLREAGWREPQAWTDEAGGFAVFVAGA